MSTEAPDPGTAPGRFVIARRAYEQLVRAIASSELGVRAKDSKVRVTDDAGQIALDISSVARADEPSLIPRIEQIKATIAERTATLTGASVSRVALRITDITFDPRSAR